MLLLGCVLRFYNLFQLEYTYDELSALSRTEYTSFSDVLEFGVKKLDTHPALIQVFLYYYCLLLGTAEWIVKLPFILAGIASIYIAYKIGKKWFNETAGLLTASILSCTQFFIFYSVTARPYITGLLLSLLAVNYLLSILFSIFLTLCAFNHHFSMMFAALCGIVGVFFTSKKNLKCFIFSIIGAIILYSPHFSILLYQLKSGGIGAQSGGWLNPPENDFILQFLFFVFHYSYVFAVLFLSLIGFTFFISKQKNNTSQRNKIRTILFSLFSLSFLIGFFYSQRVNPVIQYSTLIFATPCLLLFLTSFAGEIDYRAKWSFVLLLITVGVSTLVFKRRYYQLIFNQPFDTYVRTADKTIKDKGMKNVFSLFKGEQWFLDYYKKKYSSSANYKVIENESLSAENYKSIYDTLQTNYLLLGDFNAAQLLQASLFFPYVYEKVTGYNFEVYVLSKEKNLKTLEDEKLYFTKTDFQTVPAFFNYNKGLIISENGRKKYRVDILNEYPISFKINTKDLKCVEGETIVAEITYTCGKRIKGLLCASTDSKGENIHWTANNMTDFYNPDFRIQKVYVSVYVGPKFSDSTNEINIFVWNNNKQTFKILNFDIYKWNNNPYRYGLLSDF